MVSRLLIVLLCAFLLAPVSWASALQNFSENSLGNILAQRQGQPFILSMWSVDCQPCMQELELLSALRDEQPQLRVVLISTDGPELAVEVASILKQFNMDQAENWLFDSSNSPKLRYQVDEEWFGELPRTYFYLDAETRLVHSGLLRRTQLDRWLQMIEIEFRR